MFWFYVMIGLVFGFLAALIAFLITWNEYQKHKFKGKRLFREVFSAGLFTFIIFFLLSLFIGVALQYLNI